MFILVYLSYFSLFLVNMTERKKMAQLSRTKQWVERQPAKDAATDIYMQFSMNVEYVEPIARLALVAHANYSQEAFDYYLPKQLRVQLTKWGYLLPLENPLKFPTLKTIVVGNMIVPEVVDDDVGGRIVEPFVYPHIITDLYQSYLKNRRDSPKQE